MLNFSSPFSLVQEGYDLTARAILQRESTNNWCIASDNRVLLIDKSLKKLEKMLIGTGYFLRINKK